METDGVWSSWTPHCAIHCGAVPVTARPQVFQCSTTPGPDRTPRDAVPATCVRSGFFTLVPFRDPRWWQITGGLTFVGSSGFDCFGVHLAGAECLFRCLPLAVSVPPPRTRGPRTSAGPRSACGRSTHRRVAVEDVADGAVTVGD